VIATPDHDVDALAAVLRGYADDPERIVREGIAGRRKAEATNSAPQVARLVEQRLEQAVESSCRRRS
jgi:hypothetical protein